MAELVPKKTRSRGNPIIFFTKKATRCRKKDGEQSRHPFLAGARVLRLDEIEHKFYNLSRNRKMNG
jgi:hypothetical protein